MMHNHGPAEGDGLNCNELLMPDGSRKGKCLLTPEELEARRGATISIPRPQPVFEDPAEKVLYDFIVTNPMVRTRASQKARELGRQLDMQDPRSLISAAVAAGVFGPANLHGLVKAAMAAGGAQRG